MDFGFGNFKVWLFCCACRMHDEGNIGFRWAVGDVFIFDIKMV
jgi:hypothetical protein